MANSYTSIKRISLVREGSMRGRAEISSTRSARDFWARYWEENPAADQEKFAVACLDTKLRVQAVVVVTVGTLDASLVHPREVFRPAFIEGSSAIICSHNHPSGEARPSNEDLAVHRKLKSCGEMLGIKCIDHIIYGDGTGDTVSLEEYA